MREDRFGYGALLALWMVLVVLLQAACWLSGLRGGGLAEAVERGTARVELRSKGEVTDEAIRKAIRLQQGTLPFWAVLAALGDFVGEPLALGVRAVLVATVFGGLAALRGRPMRFEEGLLGCAWAQGFWVLGLAVRVGLMIALGRTEAETGATLLLPAGPHPATTWLALRQVDLFALLGWLAMAVGGRRRGQVGLAAALTTCGFLWALESAGRIGWGLLLGAGMRLTLISEGAA